MFKNNKVNWALAIIALLGFLVAFLVWQTPSANAGPVPGSNKDDQTNQVTVGEYYSLQKNMTRQEVTQILDGPGNIGQEHTRWYRWAGSAPKFIRVIVVYKNNLLKHAYLVAKKANQGTFDIPLKTINSKAQSASEQDGCITHKEWKNVKRSNMSGIERTLGVRGAGKVVVSQNHRQHLVKQYPWCGLSEDEGYYQISYDRNKAGLYMSNYINEFDFR
jgi:hypothetical protein